MQVSWLGYPGTTGLEAMDYRLTNANLDPPGLHDACYAEHVCAFARSVLLLSAGGTDAGGQCVARVGGGVCHVGMSQQLLQGFSGGSGGVDPDTADACRAAHLLLHAYEGTHRQRTAEEVGRAGIDPGRIRFVGYGGAKYFEFYHGIDLVLDPFPYGGGTTTCEAFWMGVPVITLAGQAACTRMGLDALTSIGLPEFVSSTEEEYVTKACALAMDLERLAELRATLRQRMQASPLMDAPRFARQVEAAYREMWRKWCGEAPTLR